MRPAKAVLLLDKDAKRRSVTKCVLEVRGYRVVVAAYNAPYFPASDAILSFFPGAAMQKRLQYRSHVVAVGGPRRGNPVLLDKSASMRKILDAVRAATRYKRGPKSRKEMEDEKASSQPTI